MKRICTLCILLLTLTLTQQVFSQTTYTTTTSGPWTNPSLWSPSNPGNSIGINDSLIIMHDINMNSDIDIYGILVINAGASVTSTSKEIKVLNGELVNNGTFQADIFPDVNGYIENKGTFTSNAELVILNGGLIKNRTPGIINCDLLNLDGGDMINRGTVNVTQDILIKAGSTFTNSGVVNTSANLFISWGGTLNGGAGTFVIEDNMDNGGTVNGGVFNICDTEGDPNNEFDNDGDMNAGAIICMCGTNEENLYELGGNWENGTYFDSNCDPNPLLPVEFVDIRANYDAMSQVVNIRWTTAMETDNDFFTIERSINGASFESIGIVDGAGTTGLTLEYSFEDDNPVHGNAFYRVKQTDFNGESTYSDITSTRVMLYQNVASIYPNPAVGGIINVNISSEVTGEVAYQITNIAGQALRSGKVISQIDLNDLTSGMYFIHFQVNDHTETESLIIH